MTLSYRGQDQAPDNSPDQPISSLPLIHLTPATLVFFLFLKFARLGPASGFLHGLLPLPGMPLSLECEPREGSVLSPAGSLACPLTAADVH